MRIQVEKFLALTALLAAGSMASTGCVTESTDTNTDAGISGGGGAGGSSTGGSGGVAGAAGGGGSAGGGGAAGGGGSAGADGGGGSDGGACLGDTGTEIADCGQLPYATTTCGDAGAEGAIKPLGYDLCLWTQGYGRLGIQAPMWDCLKAITGDACADAAAQKCADDVFGAACDRGSIPDGDGGTYDVCKSVTTSCSGTGGVTQAECDYVINATSPGAAGAIWDCYELGTGNCRDDFFNCAGLP